MTEGRLEVESKSQECLVIIKREVTSNNLPKRRVLSSTHGVVGGRRLVTASYPICYSFIARGRFACGRKIICLSFLPKKTRATQQALSDFFPAAWVLLRRVTWQVRPWCHRNQLHSKNIRSSQCGLLLRSPCRGEGLVLPRPTSLDQGLRSRFRPCGIRRAFPK